MKRRLHITIDNSLHAYLVKQAKANNHSVSYYINLLLLKEKIESESNQS